MRVSMRVSCCALPSSVGVPSDSTDASEDGRGARPPMRICATTPRASSAFMCIVSSFTRIIIGECVRGSASIYVPSQRACAKPTSDERCQRGWTLQLCGFTSSQSCMRQRACTAERDRASVPLFTHGSTMQSSSLLLFALMRRYGSYEAGRVCVRPLPGVDARRLGCHLQAKTAFNGQGCSSRRRVHTRKRAVLRAYNSWLWHRYWAKERRIFTARSTTRRLAYTISAWLERLRVGGCESPYEEGCRPFPPRCRGAMHGIWHARSSSQAYL